MGQGRAGASWNRAAQRKAQRKSERLDGRAGQELAPDSLDVAVEVRDEEGQVREIDASAPYYWAAFQLFGDWQ